MPHTRRHILTLLLTITALLTATPPPATAGTYTVHSCTTPTGTWTGMGGWTSAASSPSQGTDPGIATTCTASGVQLALQFGATQMPVPSTRWLSWTFSAPPDTHINSIQLSRSFQLAWPVVPGQYGRPYVYDAWHDADLSNNQLEFFFPPFNGDTVGMDVDPILVEQGVSWDSLSLRLRCWEQLGDHDCGPSHVSVALPRATIGLTDSDAPVTAVEGGSLVGDGAVRGVGDLLFHASDAGAGVYRSIVALDGAEVVRRVVDGNGGLCADVEPANADEHEFGTPQPCPLDASGEVQLDTATLTDGDHALRVSVEDAAGNVDVVRDGTITTHNAPISTLAPALDGTTRVGAQLATDTGQWDGAPTGFGHRWLRCDADGASCAGIAGAAAPTYTLTPADAYHRVLAEVTAENASGAASARSAATAPIADADGHTAPPPGGGSGTQPPTVTPPPVGGIGGLQNPLGSLGGHVANGASPAGHPRLTLAFGLAYGRTAHRVRSPRSRRWTLAGRLVDGAGHGIAGARLSAAWQVAGRRWVAHSGVRTGADGRFVYALPPGPTRAVKLLYFPFSDSRTFEASNVVQEDVLAPLTIYADRRRVTGARVVRLSGRVGGAPIPRGGLLVTLQGYQADWGWRTFGTVRTTRTGSWSTRYRFRLAHGRFGFRAIVPRQGDFPFVTSQSAAVVVTVA